MISGLRLRPRDFASFEFLFVLFVFAGTYKASPYLGALNDIVDLTLLAVLAGAPVAALLYLRRPAKLPAAAYAYLFLYLAFALYAGVSYFSGRQGPDATLKIQKLAVMCTWSLVAPLFIFTDEARIARFLRLVVVFGLLTSAEAVLRRLVQGGEGVLGGFGTDSYHALGRNTAMALTVCIAFILSQERLRPNWAFVAAIPVLFVGLILSGMRGAVVSGIAAALFTLIQNWRARRDPKVALRYLRVGLLAAVLAGVSLTVVLQRVDASWAIRRITKLAGSEAAVAVVYSKRPMIWATAIRIFTENPVFGAGFGSFRDESGLVDYRQPHNIFLEFLCELGLVGFAVLLALLAPPLFILYRSPRLRTGPVGLSLGAMLALFLVGAQTSGDITDNRSIFTFSALAISYAAMRAPKRRPAEGPAAAPARPREATALG